MQPSPHSFDVRSISRPLLYVNLAGPQEPITERLAACGWKTHAARSIPEALRLIEQRTFLVGLVAVASNAPVVELEGLVLANAAMEWVALLPSPPSGQGRFLTLVAEAFFDYCSAPHDVERFAGVLGHAHGKAQLRRQVAHNTQDAPDALVGDSESMRRLFRSMAKGGANDEPVLLQGESGTGKELVAHAVHRTSRRGDRDFVVVDCGASEAKQGLIKAPAH